MNNDNNTYTVNYYKGEILGNKETESTIKDFKIQEPEPSSRNIKLYKSRKKPKLDKKDWKKGSKLKLAIMMKKAFTKRRKIYPPAKKPKKKLNTNRRDSYDYNNDLNMTNELVTKNERPINKFSQYRKKKAKSFNSMKKDFPCHYKEKYKVFKQKSSMYNLHPSYNILHTKRNLEKKKLPLDNSFEGKEFCRAKKMREKLRMKMGFGRKLSEMYAKANVKLKKKNRKISSFWPSGGLDN